MRHQNHSQRIARKPAQARLLLKNLATSILLYERVRTTKKRARVVRPIVDKVIMIGKTKRPDLAIRAINTLVSDENACRKVLEVLAKRYSSRSSGFTRITPLGMRKGDGAFLCEISLIDAATPEIIEAGKKDAARDASRDKKTARDASRGSKKNPTKAK